MMVCIEKMYDITNLKRKDVKRAKQLNEMISTCYKEMSQILNKK